jgi:RHS repeat-associated protein
VVACLAVLLLTSGLPDALGAALQCYRTKQSGNWNATSTWESAPTTGSCTVWVPATLTPTSAVSTISIRAGHTVHVTASVTVDEVTVASGGDLEVDAGKTLTVANGSGVDLANGGTIGVSGTITQAASSEVDVNATGFTVNSGGLLTGNGTSQGSKPAFVVNSGGSFTIGSGGSLTTGGNGPMSLTVGAGGAATVNGSISGPDAITVNGSLAVPGGSVALASTSNLQVGGTLSVSGSGSVSAVRANAGSVGQINNGGSVSLSGTSTFSINCSGCSSDTLTVTSGGTLDLGPTAVVNGAGALIVASGGTLKVGSANGITTGTTVGNVRTGGPDSYSTGANYEYKGSAAQATGGALPASVNNLSINDAGGNVSLSGSVTVSGNLALTTGDLLTGANTLTLANGATSTGTTDVVGAAKRSGPFTAGVSYGVGNPFNTVKFAYGGTLPTDITFILAKAAPSAGTFPEAVTPIARTYTISQAGGTGFSATLRLHYADTELSGNTESTLELWKLAGGAWSAQGKAGNDATDDWVEQSGISSFSDWTLASPGPAPPNTPAMLSPADGDLVTSSPALSWSDESPSGATGYDYQVVAKGASCDFTGASATHTTSTSAPTSLAAGTWCWRVRANNSAGVHSAYSPAREFSMVGSISYIYDDEGRLTGVGGSARYHYDQVGNITSIERTDPATLQILDFQPKGGTAGTAVTIYGSAFDPTPSANTVKFNGTTAAVTSATPAQLVVTVPAGATTGTISVSTASGSVTSTASFSVGSLAPTISGFTPGIGTAGTAVTVTGTNFQQAVGDDDVELGFIRPRVSTASATSLSFTVPTAATSGRIRVLTPYGKAVGEDFFVPPAPYQASDVGATARLAFGVPQTITVTSAGKVTMAVFDGAAGQRVSLNLSAGTYANYPSLYVYNPDGTVLATPFAFGYGAWMEPTALPETGTYTVLFVPTAGSAGSMTFAVYDVPPDASGTIVPGGSSVTASTTVPGQNIALTFSGTGGQRVSLYLTNGSFSCCPVVSIIKPDGGTLASVSIWGDNRAGWLDSTTLPSTGTYTIALDPPGASTGSITFTLYDVPPDASGTITPGGASVTKSATVPGQNISLTFSGTQGQRVFLNLTNVSVPCCGSVVGIKSPDGATLASTTGSYINTTTLASTGTYTIFFDPAVWLTGSVTFTLYDVPPDASGTITPGGPSVTKSTTVPGQNIALTFDGTASQRISLRLTDGTYTCCPVVSIKRPDGTVLYGTGLGGATAWVDVLTLASTGTYTLFFDPEATATGSMTFTLYDVPPDVTGTMTIGGPSLTVSLDTPGQNANLTFSGAADQGIALDMTGVTIGAPNTGCCVADVIIKKPDGSTLASFGLTAAGGTLNTTLPVAGTYAIAVNPQIYYTGSVTLALSQTGGGLVAWTAAGGSKASLQKSSSPSPSPSPVRSTRPLDQETAPSPDSGSGLIDQTLGYSSPFPDSWTPTSKNSTGFNWQTNWSDSPWESQTQLSATAGVTAVAGQVLALNGEPLPGVTLEIGTVSARTDDTGRFLLEGVPSGHQQLVIDGTTANTSGTTYGWFETGIDVKGGRTTDLPYTIWMPVIDIAHAVHVSSPTTSDVVLTTPLIPGLEVRIPKGTTIKDDAGNAVTELSITAVPTDRPPFPLPKFFSPPVYFTVQPGGAYLSKAARVIYPNYSHQRAGARVEFWDYDPDQKGWYVYGYGTVTADGTQIVPDKGVGVWEFTGAMINDGENPPSRKANCHRGTKCKQGGDPIDLSTGLMVLDRTDLSLPGTLPVDMTRTYRNEDPNSRAFGLGTNFGYGMFLWSANQYQEVDLILPDGGRVHYVRISSGQYWWDAVFESTTTPGPFYRSRIAWVGSVTVGVWDLTLADGTLFEFGENAPLQFIRDRYGNFITLTRTNGKLGNITQVTSSSGRWVKLTYDASNRITQAQDNSGRTTGYAYDSAGRLSTVTDANQGVTTHTWDACPSPYTAPTCTRLLTITDPRNITFLTNAFDPNGRVTQQTLADGTSHYTFAYTVDGSGNVTQTDATDPRNTVERVTFNSGGYPTGDTFAVGTPVQEAFTYSRQSGTNLLQSATETLNRQTTFTYDSMGNVKTVTRLSGTPDAVTTSFDYEAAFNQASSVTDPLGHTTSFSYDSRGNLTTITDPRGKQTTIGYDSAGHPTSVTDPLSHQTTFAYEGGDLVSVTDPLGHATRAYVDAAGRQLAATDALGHMTRTAYDDLNEVTTVTDPLGNETDLSYDAGGNLSSVTDAKNHTTSYTYDVFDTPATRTDPLLRTETYVYDAVGDLISFTDRRGKEASFSYDGLNRMTFAGFGKMGSTYESTVDYTYDLGNRLTQAMDSVGGTITRAYDVLDRLTQEQTSLGTVDYTYDDAGRRATMTVAGQPATSYGYDNGNRLTSITKGSQAAARAYDDAGRPTSLTLPNGLVQAYGYDDANHLTGITYKQGQTVLGDLSYSYDARGLRTAVGGSFARSSVPASVASASYDADNELTNWGGTSLAYDPDGNLVGDGTNAYTWDARGQLGSTTGPTAASFTYDAFGRRTGKTTAGATTKFGYDGANVIQELDSSGTPTANLLTGLGVDQTFSRTDSGGASSFLTDALGSPVALADSSGAIQTSYTYEPFGRATAAGAPSSNSFQYTGREADGTGLDFNRARYYNPTFGRFISEDPIGFAGGPNLYAYAANSPINLTDPYGLFSFRKWFQNHWEDLLFLGALIFTVVLIACTPCAWGFMDALMSIPGIGSLLGGALLGTLGGAAAEEGANAAGDEAFHYTFSGAIDSIEANGLRPASYATPEGSLSPLQAQIDLALPPNRGLTDAVLRIDLAGLRDAGYEIPQVTQVGRSFNMPGGGYELHFPYRVPPEFIKVFSP